MVAERQAMDDGESWLTCTTDFKLLKITLKPRQKAWLFFAFLGSFSAFCILVPNDAN
jgi:hypothetical protein